MDESCLHSGWALWRDHWQWWCANCGITVSEPDLIGQLTAHSVGDLWRGNEGLEGIHSGELA